MPATTKDALIAVTQKEYARLDAVLATVSDALAVVKDAEDTSIKDVIAHRAHWITLFLDWYADGQAGKMFIFQRLGINGTTSNATTRICGCDRRGWNGTRHWLCSAGRRRCCISSWRIAQRRNYTAAR